MNSIVTVRAGGIALAGVVTGFMGWIGMFRNLTAAVAVAAEINNYLLPIWMIALGIILLRYRERPAGAVPV